jgi:hypothetical protein
MRSRFGGSKRCACGSKPSGSSQARSTSDLISPLDIPAPCHRGESDRSRLGVWGAVAELTGLGVQDAALVTRLAEQQGVGRDLPLGDW